MTTSLIETTKGRIEYTMLGRGVPILVVVGGHTKGKELLNFEILDKTVILTTMTF